MMVINWGMKYLHLDTDRHNINDRSIQANITLILERFVPLLIKKPSPSNNTRQSQSHL